MKQFLILFLSISILFSCKSDPAQNKSATKKETNAKKNNKTKANGNKKVNKKLVNNSEMDKRKVSPKLKQIAKASGASKNQKSDSKKTAQAESNTKRLDAAAKKALSEMDISESNRSLLNKTFDRYSSMRKDINNSNRKPQEKNKALRVLNEQQQKYIKNIIGEEDYNKFVSKLAKHVKN